MDKKIFFFIAAALIVVIVFLLIVIMAVQQRKTELANPIPTAYPTASPTPIFNTVPTSKPTVIDGEPLTVSSIIPANGATGVLRDADIEITFNHSYRFGDFITALRPDTQYEISYDTNNSKAWVHFSKPLLPNTEYTFKVNTYKTLPTTIMFTTGDATGAAALKVQ